VTIFAQLKFTICEQTSEEETQLYIGLQ